MSLKASRPPPAYHHGQANLSAGDIATNARVPSSLNGGGRHSGKSAKSRSSVRKSQALSMTCDDLIEVKSKFDAEFRRFAISRFNNVHDVDSFRQHVESLHNLYNIPFTLCYTDAHGDLLPINNDDNFRKALESATPVLRLLVQRKGESLEERYGYGTTTDSLRKRNRISRFLGNMAALPAANNIMSGGASGAASTLPAGHRQYDISMPQDFRQVSAIIDVDQVPETHRRVRLCKHGSDRPLGFYIRDGTSVRVTAQGLLKVPGIFISRLVPGGLAESTGLLAVNDEVIEVNGIEVAGKTLDQVTDMMVANACNLIITVRPCDQRLTLAKEKRAQQGALTADPTPSTGSDGEGEAEADAEGDDDVDEVKDMLAASNM